MASLKVNVVKIIFLSILVLALLLGVLVWFNILGFIRLDNFRDYVLFGKKQPIETLVQSGDPLLDLRNANNQNTIQQNLDELTQKEAELVLRQQELDALSLELDQKQADLSSKEEMLLNKEQKYNDKELNLRQNAKYLEGMQPQKAVDILNDLDDLEAVDVLRTAETLAQEEGRASLVAFWLSLMDSARAARIQSIMADPNP